MTAPSLRIAVVKLARFRFMRELGEIILCQSDVLGSAFLCRWYGTAKAVFWTASSSQPRYVSQGGFLLEAYGRRKLLLASSHSRACVQLSRIIAEARWTPARKFLASLS